MELNSDLEYLSLVEESEDYQKSRAVFSGLETGVEVKQYSNFEVYDWRCDAGFSELIECVEPLYPFVEDPAVEMIKEEGRVRNTDRDHSTLANDWVYDPVLERRNEQKDEEGRWDEYSLIQLNLNGAKIVWDQKEPMKDSRIRVYAIDRGSEVFADIFPEVAEEIEEGDLEGIANDVSQVF